MNKTVISKKQIGNVINKLLTEQYSKDEIINVSQMHLQHEFDKLNKLLFNNEIKPVPLKYMHRKTALGVVNATISRTTHVITINYLAMSTFYDVPYQNFLDTLAHEMIHVKEMQLKSGKSGHNIVHGGFFHAEAERINKMNLGFNITESSSDKLPMSGKTLEKMNSQKIISALVTVTMPSGAKKTFFSNMTLNAFHTQYKVFASIYEYAVQSEKYLYAKILFFDVTPTQNIMQCTVQRNFNSGLKYREAPQETIADIQKGDLLKTINL